ncbi:hypothetical protein ACP92_03970 [Herbaspirillum seropedicae]|nr:hypothetical protein ACP92_03970 [Herbaspirillum seropedicae]
MRPGWLIALSQPGAFLAIQQAAMSESSDVLSSSPLVLPLDLRSGAPLIGAEQAQLSRLLGRGVRLALGRDDMALLALPASATAASAVAAMAPDLRLQTADGVLLLAQGERLLAGLTGIDPAASRHADGRFAPWLAAALAGRLQQTALASLHTVQPCAAGDAAQAGLVALRLRLRDPTHAIETLAWAAPSLWRCWLEAAEPMQMPLSAWSGLPLSSTVLLATHRLPSRVMEALRVGDLLLPERPLFDIHGHGRMTLGARQWRVRYIAHQRLQIISQENALNHDTDLAQSSADLDADPDDEAFHDADASAASAEEGDEGRDGEDGPDVAVELPLTLQVELGRLSLSLSQLRALGEQVVLELHGASAQALRITSAGVELGRGEVVSVDGRLGVRIVRWSGAC